MRVPTALMMAPKSRPPMVMGMAAKALLAAPLAEKVAVIISMIRVLPRSDFA